MEQPLRLRLNVALVLLAVIAGSAMVTATSLADSGAVAAAVVGLVVLTGVVLFVGTTPEWAREESDVADDHAD
jgi:predicted membrane channel-forming protein YqfA (hemolysin III family)